MASRVQLVMNCTGPYRFLGEQVGLLNSLHARTFAHRDKHPYEASGLA
jgi:hypothetical protein